MHLPKVQIIVFLADLLSTYSYSNLFVGITQGDFQALHKLKDSVRFRKKCYRI